MVRCGGHQGEFSDIPGRKVSFDFPGRQVIREITKHSNNDMDVWNVNLGLGCGEVELRRCFFEYGLGGSNLELGGHMSPSAISHSHMVGCEGHQGEFSDIPGRKVSDANCSAL